jgi:predicted nuclease of predicted toxin-antitoxin system
MKFILDECTGSLVGSWLRELGYQVFSVYQEARGATDEKLLAKAVAENWILITNDREFADKIYRENCPHRGVIFLNLENQLAANKIETLARLLAIYPDLISDRFVVVTESQVRFTEI